MKKFSYLLVLLLSLVAFNVKAQEVNTLWWVENAPFRHYMNPAAEPMANIYISLPVIGYTSLWAGNNSVALNNVLYDRHNLKGSPTALDSYDGRTSLLKKIHRTAAAGANGSINLLAFGFRLKEKNYLHFNVTQRFESEVSAPKSVARFLFEGGENALNTNFNKVSLKADTYTEIALGYSRRINDKWTVGGKAKLLLGQGVVAARINPFESNLNADGWKMTGEGSAYMAGNFLTRFPEQINKQAIKDWTDDAQNGNEKIYSDRVNDWLKPAGYGVAFDAGFVYRPLKQLQISAAFTDLGFICWNAHKYNVGLDVLSNELNADMYNQHFATKEAYDADKLLGDVADGLGTAYSNIETKEYKKGTSTSFTSFKFNVAIDGKFWEDRVGVGLYSRTRYFNHRVTEEVTLGAYFRPVHWFNLAASYSFIGTNYRTFGAAMSIITYEGLGITLAMDYIPLSYAYHNEDAKMAYVPYKSKGVNLALGLSIVIGHDKDDDHDGVRNRKDLCPLTPRGVLVDKHGCPLDEDGDGVPDYLDQCPNTPREAWSTVDSIGCPQDTDGDGVYDYLDQCPGTDPRARGHVDAQGCELDSDGDGVPDWRDQCPGTLAEARGHVDANGCELDSDNDGVPDWKDRCPDTPKEASQYPNGVDENGCVRDTDGDGTPDYEDKCPDMAGPKENLGCPALKSTETRVLQDAMKGIQFETGKAVIKPASYNTLNQVANVFLNNPYYQVEVQGHTDSTGNPDKNLILSQKRADAVRDYLISRGVPASQLTSVGYGDTKPIDTNETKAGRANNRRVEFIYQYTETITHEEYQYQR